MIISLIEYKPGSPFSGVIGRAFDLSEPAWLEPNRARQGAPHVLLIILDDPGCGKLRCYSSPSSTLNLDSKAEMRQIMARQ